LMQASHCHCERCRKHSGTSVCTQARVLREQFRLLQGKELIKVYGIFHSIRNIERKNS
jgi:hypothetical protein